MRENPIKNREENESYPNYALLRHSGIIHPTKYLMSPKWTAHFDGQTNEPKTD